MSAEARSSIAATLPRARPRADAGPRVEPCPGVRSPLDSRQRIRAVLFDLDGTLYHQTPMRVLMALEFAALSLASPFRARRRWRALSAYRQAQEQLRKRPGSTCGPLSQVDMAAERTGMRPQQLTAIVDEWMLRRPIKYMRWCRAAGVLELLGFLAAKGIKVGVLSDYPAETKLAALGLSGCFSLVLCSTDPGVASLKPDPRGFRVACDRWQLDPREVLMVGDRIDVDAVGAAAAGMPCVIIGRPRADHNGAPHLALASLKGLCCALDDRR
jgi:putative hydrolase of the HAD superfamily